MKNKAIIGKKGFLQEMLSSGGAVSSKRVIVLAAFILMGVGFIANTFWGFKVDASLYDSLKWIVIGGMGAVASEKFAKVIPPAPGAPTDDAPVPEGGDVAKN